MELNLVQFFSPASIILFMVVFTRLNGMITSAPLFSTYPIPMQIKIWLVASITFIMFPFIQAKTSFVMPSTMPELFVILLKEFSIGYVIGFCANLIFIGVDFAANLFSVQMGLSASQALNPTSGSQSPVLTQGYTLLAAMVFISLNAHQWLLSAVYDSFVTMPVGYGFIFSGELVQQILVLVGQVFTIGLGIALPIFGVLFITDVLLGFMSKVMPQMNIFMVSMPLKIYVGLLLSVMFVAPISEYLTTLTEKFLIGIMGLF